MKIINEEAATPLDALTVLEERDDLSPEQEETLGFYRRVMQLEDKDTYTELADELETVDGLKPHQIHKLLEVMPVHPATITAVFEKERVNLDDNDVNQILSIVDSVRNT